MTSATMLLAKTMRKTGAHKTKVLIKGYLDKKTTAKVSGKQMSLKHTLMTEAVKAGKAMRSAVESAGLAGTGQANESDWDNRFFVLVGGQGSANNVPKLLYFASEEDFEHQKRQTKEAGFGWFDPKGSMDLVGASTVLTNESLGGGGREAIAFAVRTPMRTIHLKSDPGTCRAWIEKVRRHSPPGIYPGCPWRMHGASKWNILIHLPRLDRADRQSRRAGDVRGPRVHAQYDHR